MASNGIPPEEKNITALKQLTDEKLKVGSQIDELYKLLSDSEDTSAIKTIESKLTSVSKPIPEG